MRRATFCGLWLLAACASRVVAPPQQAVAALVTAGSRPTTAAATPASARPPPKTDDELFEQAQLARDAGELEAAAVAYVKLTQESPRLAPDAWLALGDMAFERADLDAAEHDYDGALRTPPAANKGWGYAAYKLAFVYENQGRDEQAMASLVSVVRWAAEFPRQRDAVTIGRMALRDLLPVFARVGKASTAYAFLRSLTGDDQRTLDLLPQLAKQYEAYGTPAHLAGARSVYQQLSTRDPARACEWDARARFSVAGASPQALEAKLKACP